MNADEKDFLARTELDQFINRFAQEPASWRREFLDRFEASPLDDGGKELLGTLAKLHFELIHIKDET